MDPVIHDCPDMDQASDGSSSSKSSLFTSLLTDQVVSTLPDCAEHFEEVTGHAAEGGYGGAAEWRLSPSFSKKRLAWSGRSTAPGLYFGRRQVIGSGIVFTDQPIRACSGSGGMHLRVIKVGCSWQCGIFLSTDQLHLAHRPGDCDHLGGINFHFGLGDSEAMRIEGCMASRGVRPHKHFDSDMIPAVSLAQPARLVSSGSVIYVEVSASGEVSVSIDEELQARYHPRIPDGPIYGGLIMGPLEGGWGFELMSE